MNIDFKKPWVMILTIVGLATLFNLLGLTLFSFSFGKFIKLIIGLAIISQAKNSLFRGNILSAIILFILGLFVALGAFISFFPIFGLLIRIFMTVIFIYFIASFFLPNDMKIKFFSNINKRKDRYKDSFYEPEQDQYDYNTKRRSNYSSTSKKAKEFFGNDPDDPFSYKNRSYSNVEDVEYEDWIDPEEYKKKTKVDNMMEYSYSDVQSENIRQRMEEESNSHKINSDFDRNIHEDNRISKDKHSVSLGSIKINIEKEDLRAERNKIYINCNLGEAKVTIDKSIPTNIYGKISMGEIKIGRQSYSGFNNKIHKKWIPKRPYDKSLDLYCTVSLGEIRIRHK